LQEFDNRRRLESAVGRFTMLHWNPRLVALIAVIALILLALGGLGIEVDYNLYW
jgi:hypothetical protein